MSRLPRFLRKDRTTVYHVVSRTALDGLPMKAEEKDYLLELIRKFSKVFFIDILGFCVMGNHLHLVCRVYPEDEASDEEVKRRFREFYGQDLYISAKDIDYYRKRWTSLSELIKDIKQSFYPVKCRSRPPALEPSCHVQYALYSQYFHGAGI